ncbi:DNA-binding transcriptional regulator, IclR family [Paracoccus isoporae]|uniref:DNA-binding transcriptional regulator, IclR family n=1 Tax=Paracoccus isoporae TaxID=591205 RepID=A0A1G7A3X3_9RHOB|nr:IclR family transcriptional regulator [Paracoccus isoporae]SDE08755.1 DNA-binding transcriptional regulator, IclR family [Paracoccus isoporae]
MPDDEITPDRFTPDRPEAEDADRQFVSALARGMEILTCFGTGDRSLSNQEIARRTGLARPTVSRLTYTLMKTGFLLKIAETGAYRLGPKVLQLGFSTLAATDVGTRFSELTADLCRGPNAHVTVALAERSGTRAVYLAVRRSRQAVTLSIDLGARLPLFYSGIGRAILAGMPEAERVRVLDKAIAEFPGQRDRLKTSLRKAVADYARYGYCTSFGDWKPEINAIAAPIRSLDGSAIYGVNIGGPSFLVPADELHEQYGDRLCAAVEALGKP